jgi:hypothetical protein
MEKINVKMWRARSRQEKGEEEDGEFVILSFRLLE